MSFLRKDDRMLFLCDGCGGELVEGSPANTEILIRRAGEVTKGLDLCALCVANERARQGSSMLGRFLAPSPFIPAPRVKQ